MISRAQLAITLSRLEDFKEPNPAMEQYMTDSETASQMLWGAFMQGDIKDKIVADLGAGTGVLGLGALLLGAKWVIMVEADGKALEVARRNYEALRGRFGLGNNITFIHSDLGQYSKEVDTVIENPPFGVQNEHADRPFLLKAFEVGKAVYSLHKIESQSFIEGLAKEGGFHVTHVWRYSLPLKKTMEFHTHKIERVAVGCFRLEKNLG
jgi:putative methylase